MRTLLLFGVVVMTACAAQPEAAVQTVRDVTDVAETSVKPITGGTVAVADNGWLVLVSDQDRDQVIAVDLKSRSVKGRLSLGAGSRPTRAVDDGRGHFAVVLRGAGELVWIDQAQLTLEQRLHVCGEPTGVTRTLDGNELLVACATGELVQVAFGAAPRERVLGLEARDVIQARTGTWVSTFRSASLVEVSGAPVAYRPAPVVTEAAKGVSFDAQVAWRTLLAPNDDLVMIHQLHRNDELSRSARPESVPKPPVPQPYYGWTPPPETPSPCADSVVRSAVSVFRATGSSTTTELQGVLPVDAALSPDGDTLLIANAANDQLVTVDLRNLVGVVTGCGPINPQRMPTAFRQPVGVAWTKTTTGTTLQLIHYREPHELVIRDGAGAELGHVALTKTSRMPAGFELFHQSTGAVACASCHPEAGEDGHTWALGGLVRRTQSLSGGLLATAPFHWQGELASLDDVMARTFVSRMGGTMPARATIDGLGAFLDAVPAPRALRAPQPVDEATGAAVFVKAGCARCHEGAQMGSRSSLSVGLGEAFQVPSLVGVSRRGPWMHDGCAKTLRERFTNEACGGPRHGEVSNLAPGELDTLIAWLETR